MEARPWCADDNSGRAGPNMAAGVPRCGATFTGKPFCSGHSAPKGTGTGSSAEIYFTASRHRAPDETLLHELVHASRMIDGVWYPMPVNGGYGNQESFSPYSSRT